MKYIVPLLLLILSGCASTNPFIVPDTTSDSVALTQLKHNIETNAPTEPNYGWVFWYIPVALIAVMWAYKELFKQPSLDESSDENTKNDATANIKE